jgi:hypothetical protein
MKSVYRGKFFSERDLKTKYSARTIMPILQEVIGFRSMIDVGCGVGTWLSVAREMGIQDSLGVEGPWLARESIVDESIEIHRHDLSKELTLNRTFDLAISLEVAEHLPEESAADFVLSLCNAAPVVFFGAAMPGQTGGVGHINMQWQNWWSEKFALHDYRAFDFVRPAIWHDRQIPVWYRQNPIVYARSDAIERLNLDSKSVDPILDVVHPDFFNRYFRKRAKVLQRWRKWFR